jgi:hypothetical protein
MRILSLVIVVFLVADVYGRKKKWLKHPSIVVLKKNTGEVKEIPTEGLKHPFNNTTTNNNDFI